MVILVLVGIAVAFPVNCPHDTRSYLGDGRVRIVTYIANPNGGGCVPQIKSEGIPRYPTVEDYKDYKGSGGSFPNIRIARQIKYAGIPEKEEKSKPTPKPKPKPKPFSGYYK